MQHTKLQGLFANFSGKHFVGEVGRSNEKNSWNYFSEEIILQNLIFKKNFSVKNLSNKIMKKKLFNRANGPPNWSLT